MSEVVTPQVLEAPRPLGLNDEDRRARAALIVQMQASGIPQGEIGRHFGISRRRVTQIRESAEQHGVVEEVRTRMQKEILQHVPSVYSDVLTKSAEELADPKVIKGWELKVKAARSASEGLGVFRKQTEA